MNSTNLKIADATAHQFCFDDEAVAYTGITFGARWNGWRTPYFTYDVALQFTRDYAQEVRRVGGALYPVAWYDAYADCFVFQLDLETNDPDYIEAYDALLIDGVRYYAIGAWNWCWDIV